MTKLLETFTSTGSKFFAHQEAMNNLRNGKGQCITSHIMCTDICNHSCAFCSVQHRAGDSLPFDDIMAYLDILLRFGLKAVILSGGGNPILYKCKSSGRTFNDVVDAIHGRGLEIGLITNGMPMKVFENYDINICKYPIHSRSRSCDECGSDTSHFIHCSRYCNPVRESWVTVKPETLDKLTWIRISMAGLDHEENEVYVPDIDQTKTTLGFSYVAHDLYDEPADKAHGKVSTEADLITLDRSTCKATWRFEERIPALTEQIGFYVRIFKPRYVRLLPNCLEPNLIDRRCEQLQAMANEIDQNTVFVQYKPPKAPNICLLGYIHPVLNCDGYVYPCDSCVLNQEANHQFANPWRVCHWRDVASIYEWPIKSLIADPKKTCPGCVFTQSNLLLESVWDGSATVPPMDGQPEHANFV